MIEVAFSSSFKRAFKKRIKLEKFIENPFAKEFRTHKLTGKLKDLWSFSLGYDLRVIFFFAEDNKVVLIDIGNHEEVY